NKALDQIQDERLRPHTLRKDHWLPVVAVSGFSSYSSMITTFNKLLYNLQEAAKKKSKKKIMLNNINIAAELNNEKKIGEKTKAYQKILSRIDKKEEQFNAANSVLDNSVVNLCSILKDLSKNRLEVEGEISPTKNKPKELNKVAEPDLNLVRLNTIALQCGQVVIVGLVFNAFRGTGDDKKTVSAEYVGLA
ncbi:14107_t:CDS:2, partial [Entrophospora sp. SA101]